MGLAEGVSINRAEMVDMKCEIVESTYDSRLATDVIDTVGPTWLLSADCYLLCGKSICDVEIQGWNRSESE